MKKNKQKEDNNEEILKKGFFKKLWYSIDKIEKYSELSAEGLKSSIKYLLGLIAILALVSASATIYKIVGEVKYVAEYIRDDLPELTYKDEILTVSSKQVLVAENLEDGKIIIDTNTEDKEQINKYINNSSEEKTILVLLKDRLILRQSGIAGTVEYNYNDIFSTLGITEFNNQTLYEHLIGKNMISLYANLFLVLFIYSIVIYLINTLFNIFVISIFGYFATIILKMKIRYVAVFNMAVYATTLSTILNMIYLAVNAFVDYTINYFDIMYILISSIYIFAAIFILKVEFNKKQGEVQQIIEVEKEIKKENEEAEEEDKKDKEQEEKQEQEEKKEVKKPSKKKKENEEKSNDSNGKEPEGSNA